MSDEEALLQAIVAAPSDLFPRMIYADWLDESGQPELTARAEFIRGPCQLEAVARASDRPGNDGPSGFSQG